MSIDHILLIKSPNYEHLGWFYVQAIVNAVVVNMHMKKKQTMGPCLKIPSDVPLGGPWKLTQLCPWEDHGCSPSCAPGRTMDGLHSVVF